MRSLLLSLLVPLSLLAAKPERPNIVWIVSEDNSIHYLDHFFEGGADTPNIKALAEHGLTFDHAFSNSPVCSVARTTLATMSYGPRMGAQFHRRYQSAAMPKGQPSFYEAIRDAGYFTTNHTKEDFAVSMHTKPFSKGSDWRVRPDKSQPFFHMESHTDSHEGRLHFSQESYENDKTTHDPAKIKLADYHPDTPIFRYTHARYLDCMLTIDGIVGKLVTKLEEDGLLEDTFIFYFGDHGGVLPRGKGYPYESGLHVPLIVRVPANFKHLVDADLGERLPGFVQFTDFGPTALNLAGAKIPEGIDGKPFLGQGVTAEEVNSRDTAFGYADRFDEKYDLIRSIRKGRFQYLRNYQPYLPDGLMNIYRYKSLAYKEWGALAKAGKLTGAPTQFYEPKQPEALYDCVADPHQVHNLAEDPHHHETLLELRGLLQAQVKGMPDLSFYPESKLIDPIATDPTGFGQKNKDAIGPLIDIADLALLPFEEAKAPLTTALQSKNAMHRYWAAMVCSAFGNEAAPLMDLIEPLAKDEDATVRLRAIEFLGLTGTTDPQPLLAELVNGTDDPIFATEVLNSVVLFNDHAPYGHGPYLANVAGLTPPKGADTDDRINYLKGDPYPAKNNKKKAKK